MGATNIVMSEHAELGPLDIHLGRPDELGESRSGLVAMQALKTLEEESFTMFERSLLELRARSGFKLRCERLQICRRLWRSDCTVRFTPKSIR